MDVQTLATLEQLRQLKYRYLRCLDTKDWDGFAATLTDDFSGDYGDRLTVGSRDEAVTFMRSTLGPEIITVHQVHHPELTVDPDGLHATGRWALDDTVLIGPGDLLLRGAAYYTDTYRLGADGAWRIATTAYTRLYEYTVTGKQLPGFALTAGGQGVAPDPAAAPPSEPETGIQK